MENMSLSKRFLKEGREKKSGGTEGTECRDLRSLLILEMSSRPASDGIEMEDTP